MPAILSRCASCYNNNTETYAFDHYNRPWCRACYVRNFVQCRECGEYSPRGDCRQECNSQGRYFLCSNCRETDTWALTPAPWSIATYDVIGSKRKYGVELETSHCRNYRQLKGKTLFGAKYDGSISGMEFISPIMYGDQGLQEIDHFCRLASSFCVDDDCGYHLHIDMRDETSLQLRHVAYAYAKSYDFWRQFVSMFRQEESEFCHRPSYSAESIKNHTGRITEFFSDTDRYNYVNLYAYNCHKTFEVRIHDGTLNYNEIVHWIMAHTRFVDTVKDMTYSAIDRFMENTRDNMLSVWDKSGKSINDYYRQRVFGI